MPGLWRDTFELALTSLVKMFALKTLKVGKGGIRIKSVLQIQMNNKRYTLNHDNISYMQYTQDKTPPFRKN